MEDDSQYDVFRTDLRPEPSPKPRTDSLGDSNQLFTSEGVARAERANSATSFASTLSLSGDFCKVSISQTILEIDSSKKLDRLL